MQAMKRPTWPVAIGSGLLLALTALVPMPGATAAPAAPAARVDLVDVPARALVERALDPDDYVCGPTMFDFYVDDKQYHSVTRNPADDFHGWPFDQRFHLIMNVAVGGNWGGAKGVDQSIWPQRMEIDYVRIFQ